MTHYVGYAYSGAKAWLFSPTPVKTVEKLAIHAIAGIGSSYITQKITENMGSICLSAFFKPAKPISTTNIREALAIQRADCTVISKSSLF